MFCNERLPMSINSAWTFNTPGPNVGGENIHSLSEGQLAKWRSTIAVIEPS